MSLLTTALGHVNNWATGFLLVLMLALTNGCGRPTARVEVAGEVTVDSQPLNQGTISLLPDRGHRGPAATTRVQDGRFEFDTETGPMPGKHRAVISMGAQLPNGQPVQSTDAASTVAKRAPTRPNPIKPGMKEEPKNEPPSPSRWEVEMEVPAIGSADSGKPFRFDFQSAEAVQK